MAISSPFRDLAARMTGPVVIASDPDWDATRQVFNLATDLQPAAMALPHDVEDVIVAVRHARANGLRVAPQATGHNAAPLGALDDALLVDVRELQTISIDRAAQRVRVGAGVKWRQVVPRLSELGLAALHGSSPDVGIAGYSLGGGMGWLARTHGLQANSVTAIELVTAEGRALRVDAEHDPDLFWALRGGNGNFGVVTALEFAVYPLPELYAGGLFFPFERSGEVVHAWAELAPGMPDAMMTWTQLLQFPDLPDLPDAVRGQSFAVVLGAFLGDEPDGRALLQPVRDLGPAMDTFATVAPVALSELAMDPVDPLPIASTTALLGSLPPACVDDLVTAVGPASGSPLALVQLRQLGGALARRAPGSGARATLPGEVSLFALGIPVDEPSATAARTYLDRIDRAVAAHRVGDYPSFVEEPSDASAFFDAGTWSRLREVKAAHDPDDLFKGNHHIPPAD